MIRIKGPHEQAILKEGGRRHKEILDTVSAAVAPGVSTGDLEDLARALIKEGGDTAAFLGYTPDGARRSYPAALCISINDAIVHGIPNENPYVIQDGDVVSIDLGLVHDGLITDSARTVIAGTGDEVARRLVEATEQALAAGVGAVSPGGRVGDIGAAILASAKRSGFRIVEGLAGHGVGYAVHEDPFVPNTGKKGTGERLVPGLVIAIEPMLTPGNGRIVLDKDGYTYRTQDQSLSAHAEHTVLVTESEVIVLTA
jgi:methionyl aminopeptidase